MKEIEVQTENQNKEIIKSSVIKIDENSDRIKVIVSIGDTENFRITREIRTKIHEEITKSIEDGAKVITLPWFVKINTIKI